jgi:hypothetical protein
VTKQPGLDLLGLQRLSQQRVVEKVNLADGEVVRRAPVGVGQPEIVHLVDVVVVGLLAIRLGRYKERTTELEPW